VVASSTEQPYVNQRLKTANLLHRFDAIVSGSDVEKTKPDPALFLKAALLIGAEPRQCLVLEDSPIGVKAADAAGMPVILVPDRAPIPAEISSMVVDVFPSLDDVRLYLLGQT
jgi:beta-phosphoglucomutase-like phosphatase (HAD superfamily)